MDIVGKLNWVDILVVGIVARAIYIGVKRGFTVEFFKLCGALLALYTTFHFCSSLAHFFIEKMSMPSGLAHMVVYGLLWGLMTAVVKLIRDALLVLLRIEPHDILNKWGSLFLALFRGLILASMTLVLFEVSQLTTLTRYTTKSLTGAHIARLGPNMYEACYENFIVKIFPREKLNKSVLKGMNPSPKRDE